MLINILNISTTAWGAVPVQDFSENGGPNQLIKLKKIYLISIMYLKNIRTFIRKNIQRKTEENIINKE